MGRTFVVLALLCLFPSCGELIPWPRLGPHWHADPRPVIREWGMGLKTSTLVLPETRYATQDGTGWEPRARQRVLNVLRGGDVVFKGGRWRLGAETAEARAEALSGLAEAMASSKKDADVTFGEEASLSMPLLLNVDRAVGWRRVRALLLLAVGDASFRTNRLRWSVWCPSLGATPEWWQEATPTLATGADVLRSEAGRRELSIVLAATDGTSRPVIDLTIADAHWSFGELPDAPFADPAFIRRANTIWSDVYGLFAEEYPPSVALQLQVVSGEQDLPWTFVVKVLDLLAGAGVRDVSLTGEGLHLDLAGPGAWDPAAHRDRPLVTPALLLACAAAVLLAFVLTLVPIRGRS